MGVVCIRPWFGSDAATHFKFASYMNFTCMYIAKFTSAIYVFTSLSKKPKTDQEYVHPNRAPEAASMSAGYQIRSIIAHFVKTELKATQRDRFYLL